MEEIWKNIFGYEGLYQISNHGRVKSLKFGKEKILKSRKDKYGYHQVILSKEGKIKNHLIHRLVAYAFIDNPNNLPQVNHKDEDKTNNMVENLEYCDRIYNLNYGTHNERMAKAKSIPILQFTKQGEFIKKWDSAIQVERVLGFNSCNIYMCCKGRRKSAHDYKWRYYFKGIWLKNHIPLKDKKVA